MSQATNIQTKNTATAPRRYPKIETDADGNLSVNVTEPDMLQNLFGTRTDDAACGLFVCAMNALGQSGEIYRPFMSAIAAELEPRDAAEAMLVTQMAATHVAITSLSYRMMGQNQSEIRESLERSMTRLSRTYLAQIDSLKRYRSKAQQIVRVERVTVNDGGQAVVGAIARDT